MDFNGKQDSINSLVAKIIRAGKISGKQVPPKTERHEYCVVTVELKAPVVRSVANIFRYRSSRK
jgi:hypothetical protein